MSKIFNNIEVSLDEELSEKLQWLYPDYSDFRILRQSVDARQRHNPHFVYSIEVAGPLEKLETRDYPVEKKFTKALSSWSEDEKPIIIGSGPAGLFAALRLVERGIPCRLFERGSQAEERIKGINKFWRYGQLDPRNNVCFGEGGAGLYSDGKLITRIKSPEIPYVLHRLVKFGAPAEIQWLSNPHVGSDKIRRVIPLLRNYLRENGCEIHFNSQVMELLTDPTRPPLMKSTKDSSSDTLKPVYQKRGQITGVRTEQGKVYHSPYVILATGHSSEDMIYHLNKIGIHLDGKSFAMGLRIEHPQKLINKIQYRDVADHPKLKSANYKLADHDKKTDIGVYSFCMCPGGYVLSSGTEADGIVCNGMSNFNRNSPFANAALVVSVNFDKNFGQDLMGGMKLRRQLETNAYQAVLNAGGTKELPAQTLKNFINGKTGEVIKGSSPSGAIATRLDQILPSFIKTRIIEGLEKFNDQMKGFISEDSQLYGVESRTSCPIRVTRDSESLESLSHEGLYPCGEGAGYAGGITSAACDGIAVAEAISRKIQGF